MEFCYFLKTYLRTSKLKIIWLRFCDRTQLHWFSLHFSHTLRIHFCSSASPQTCSSHLDNKANEGLKDVYVISHTHKASTEWSYHLGQFGDTSRRKGTSYIHTNTSEEFWSYLASRFGASRDTLRPHGKCQRSTYTRDGRGCHICILSSELLAATRGTSLSHQFHSRYGCRAGDQRIEFCIQEPSPHIPQRNQNFVGS